MNAETIAKRFDKARREGRTWRFACPLCGKPKAWARNHHSEIKLGCWGCDDWKELRRIAFGDERSIKTVESLGRGKWWAKTEDEAAAAFSEVRLAQTLALWRRAPSIEGTLGARYLRSRGLDPDRFDLEALRFSSMQWHWPSRSTWPALLALVSTHEGRELSVHQTFLSLDGAGKAAIEKARLYRAGLPIAGGGVWFGKAKPKGEFVIAEGIETTLASMACTQGGRLRGAVGLRPRRPDLAGFRQTGADLRRSRRDRPGPGRGARRLSALASGRTRRRRQYAQRHRRRHE